ncbi:hypothetical protein GCM10010439_03490 [Actinocorallia aurantiaca]|uniref:Uncharacterized protein n=1 Tax=Actinocorallia aurantiaca TaxID=46204 RepID=A0ABN3TUN1_9ACTN
MSIGECSWWEPVRKWTGAKNGVGRLRGCIAGSTTSTTRNAGRCRTTLKSRVEEVTNCCGPWWSMPRHSAIGCIDLRRTSSRTSEFLGRQASTRTHRSVCLSAARSSKPVAALREAGWDGRFHLFLADKGRLEAETVYISTRLRLPVWA